MRDHQQEPINFLHWTVEEFDQSRAQATLQAATGFDTDFLCLVNINTVLKLPWKEELSDLPYQKVQWPFLFASRWPMTCEIVLRENHTYEHPLNIARGSIEHPDGPITFVALDCPSDPSLSGWARHAGFRKVLDLALQIWSLATSTALAMPRQFNKPFPPTPTRLTMLETVQS